jgi:adenine-specific DNA-methyltransferase
VSNEVLNDFFHRLQYSVRDNEFDYIYVNGDNNLENMRTEEDTWKVVLIEQEFNKQMFNI